MDTSNNLTEYIGWRGDLPFTVSSVDVADGMVFSVLSYLDFLPLAGHLEGTTLREAVRQLSERDLLEPVGTTCADPDEFTRCVLAAAGSRRFGETRLAAFTEEVSERPGSRYAAVAFDCGSNVRCVCLRSPYVSLEDLKQEFVMSFERTPAHEGALAFVRRLLQQPGQLCLFGHCGGANLAQYCAAHLPPAEQERLLRVDLYDGPGLSPALLADGNQERIAGKITRVIPPYLVTGTLYVPDVRAIVVKSTAVGVRQSDLLSWSLRGGQLERVESFTPGSLFLARTFDQWIEGATPPKQRKFVDGLFSSIAESGIQSLADLARRGPTTFENMVFLYVFTPGSETKVSLSQRLRFLVGGDWRRLWKKFTKYISYIRSSLSRDGFMALCMVVIGLLLYFFAHTSLQLISGVAVFLLAGAEGLVTFRELSENQMDLQESRYHIALTLCLVALAAGIVVRDGALAVLGSFIISLFSVTMGCISVSRIQRGEPGQKRTPIETINQFLYPVQAALYFLLGAGVLLAPARFTDVFATALGMWMSIDGLIRFAMSKFSLQVWRVVQRIPFVSMLLKNNEFRSNASLLFSTGISVAYSLLYLIPGFLNRSGWMLTIGAFPVVTGIMRAMLTRDLRRIVVKNSGSRERMRRSRLRSGLLVIILANAFLATVLYTVLFNHAYSYAGLWLYAVGMIVFIRVAYCVGITFAFRNSDVFPGREITAMRIASTLVAVYAFQTALMSSLSAPFRSYSTRANLLIGFVFFLVIVFNGVDLLLRKHEQEKETPRQAPHFTGKMREVQETPQSAQEEPAEETAQTPAEPQSSAEPPEEETRDQ